MTIDQLESIIDEVVEEDGFMCDQTRKVRDKIKEIMS